MNPLEITQIYPAQLHHFWPFLEAGLHEIKVECKADWSPEDHYAGIYHGRYEAFLLSREGRRLGFYDGYPTLITAAKPDLKYFVYCIYSVYPKDRVDADRESMLEDRVATIEFMRHRARELKCSYIETVSPRFFHMKLGFDEYARIYRLPIMS